MAWFKKLARRKLNPRRLGQFTRHMCSLKTADAPRINVAYRGKTSTYLVGMNPTTFQPIVIDTNDSRLVRGLERRAVISAFFRSMTNK